MKNDDWEKAKKIFGDAIKIAPDERVRFLDEVCDGDKTVRREVESLLLSYDEAESFMETPAVGEVAEVIKQAKNLETGRCFGHYEIIEQIGAGGMGEVYLANDKKLDRQVAVKILNEKFSRDESNLDRFIQEAKAASALNHPNILVIHEIGEAGDVHFIVSEFIKGETLREIFKEKTLKLSEVLDVSIQIAGALCTAHEAHLVHRDVKPENIMIRPDGFVKILDFGLAKLIEQQPIGFDDKTVRQNETAKGVILGTVNYMSPEQAKGEKVDERTDIFSFGAVIYEMITGRTPFAGDSVSETFANLINTESQPLSHFAANMPDVLQRIVSKMLQKNKDERYQTAKDLLIDFKDLRESLAFDERLEKLHSLSDENETAILQATTDDANKQTAAPTITTNGHHFSVERRGNVLALADWKTNEQSESGDNQSQISEPVNAFQAYQLSRYHFHQITPTDLIKARAFLEEAIRLDAAYAPAYAALAEQFITETILGMKTPAEGIADAKNAIRQAADLNANSAEFFAAAGFVELVGDWNFAEAENNLRKSLELNPHCAFANNYLGQVFMFQRRFDEAETCLQRAAEIEPRGLYNHNILTIAYFLAGKNQKVIEECEKTLAVYPQFIIAAQMRCWALEQTGRAAEAVAEYEKILKEPHGEFARRWLGYAYALVGDEEKARETAVRLVAESREHYVSSVHLAMLYSGLNEADKACFYLETAFEERDPWMLWIAADPRFDNLRADSRFQKLEKSVISAETNRAAPPGKQAKAEILAEITSIPPNNLTVNLSPIIGRENEIWRIKNLLSQNDVRLVTLVGVGGTGKTRLAQAVAQEMLPDFSDGVFFVELAAVTNPELVASTIAQPLGVKEASGKPMLEALKDYLRGRQILLVVDNFEQVIESAPNIAELLAAADNLKILITSRVRLHLSAEREFVVSPLIVPDETSNISLDELSNYEAIRLFVERARNVKPNFALTNENAGDVADICARLDGLPLAIELAAARIKILSPRAILAKLENCLKLLTGGASDLPTRQQTMRDTIEWSYDLLNENEKTLFRRLAVFAGGFTFEAAESVVNCPLSFADEENTGSNQQRTKDDGQRTIDVLDSITTLLDKNLLVSKESADDEQRFRMLEVVREYALESLEKSHEAEAMRRSHALYFLALGETAEPFLQVAQSAEWLNRLEEEHDNLRIALRWAVDNDVAAGQRSVGAIWRFWWLHGHIREGCEQLDSFLVQTAGTDKTTRTKMLLGAYSLNRLRGNLEPTRSFAEESLTLARETGDQKSGAMALYQLGLLALDDEDFTLAKSLFENGLLFAEDSGDKQVLALLLNGLGEFSRLREDYQQATDFYRQALEINMEIGDLTKQVTNLINLGATALAQKEMEAAGAFYRNGLKISSKMADMNGTLYCLEGVAGAFWAVRKPERAALLFGAAEVSRQASNLYIETSDRLPYDQSVALVRESLTEKAFADLFADGRKLKLEEAVALCLEKTGGRSKQKS